MGDRSRRALCSAAVACLGLAYGQAWAGDKPATNAEAGPACGAAGPQAPRDIDSRAGANKVRFEAAPKYQEMNLCNIHFHNQAEHKAAEFALYADGDRGRGGGYQCAMSRKLSAAELAAPAGDICKGLRPGDTIEVHWVHSSCDVEPGKGLESCLRPACKSPKLRVEAQVFTLVNDPRAPPVRQARHQQPRRLVQGGQRVRRRPCPRRAQAGDESEASRADAGIAQPAEKPPSTKRVWPVT